MTDECLHGNAADCCSVCYWERMTPAEQRDMTRQFHASVLTPGAARRPYLRLVKGGKS